MNKIKLMYDVAKAMKEKEVFIGTAEASGKKDQVEFFSFANEFEKNLASGEVKFKVKTAFDLDGKQVKHESSSEFNLQNCCGGMQHHPHRHLHRHWEENDGRSCCCAGFKNKLSALMFLLRLLDELKIEELENKYLELSLNIDGMPEEFKKQVQEKLQHCAAQEETERQDHHRCMKELLTMENPKIAFTMLLDAEKAVKKAVITVTGKQKDEQETLHDLSLKAELKLK